MYNHEPRIISLEGVDEFGPGEQIAKRNVCRCGIAERRLKPGCKLYHNTAQRGYWGVNLRRDNFEDIVIGQRGNPYFREAIPQSSGEFSLAIVTSRIHSRQKLKAF